MKRLIENWLNSTRNYIAGVILYKQFGADAELKEHFAKSKSEYLQKRLLEELQKLYKDEQPPIIEPKKAATFEEMPEDKKDAVLLALRNEWMPHFTKMNYLRHQLDSFLEDESERATIRRGKIAGDILTLEKKCMAIWLKRDTYLATGLLPSKKIEKAEPVVDAFKAAKRIEQLKIYVRRYKNKIKKEPANALHAEKITKYQTELKTLTTQHDK